MAHSAYPTGPVGLSGHIQGRAPMRFQRVVSLSEPGHLLGDRRILNPTTGTISDQVVVKAGGIEIPFANGRVWLLRLADGYKSWEGWSDAAGYYTATGLELGVEYVAVAIDPLRNFKTVGAGPVTAV